MQMVLYVAHDNQRDYLLDARGLFRSIFDSGHRKDTRMRKMSRALHCRRRHKHIPIRPRRKSTPCGRRHPGAKGVDHGSGRSTRRAKIEDVALSVFLFDGDAKPIRTATTDAQGRFSIKTSPAGRTSSSTGVKKEEPFWRHAAKRRTSQCSRPRQPTSATSNSGFRRGRRSPSRKNRTGDTGGCGGPCISMDDTTCLQHH